VRSAFIVLAGLAALLLAGGCSSPTTGTATAGTSSAPATSVAAPTSNTNGAPKVATPVDSTKYQSAPCSVVTPAQVQTLNITPRKGYVPANACGWDLPNNNIGMSPGGVTAGFVLHPMKPDEPLGLAGIYGYYHAIGSSPPSRLPDIQGQPAVMVKPTNKCDVYVGLTDNLVFHVSVLITDPQSTTVDPCALAQNFAAAAMTTMKSAA
jgi:hypothetical protein